MVDCYFCCLYSLIYIKMFHKINVRTVNIQVIKTLRCLKGKSIQNCSLSYSWPKCLILGAGSSSLYIIVLWFSVFIISVPYITLVSDTKSNFRDQHYWGLPKVQQWQWLPCRFSRPAIVSILSWYFLPLLPLCSSLLWFQVFDSFLGSSFSFPHTPQVYHTIFQPLTNLSFFLFSSIASLIIPLIITLVPNFDPVSMSLAQFISIFFFTAFCNNKILITNINSDWLNKLCFLCIIKYLAIERLKKLLNN